MGVAVIHHAAGFIPDVGQDDGAVDHPGQPLERNVEPAVGEDLVAGFFHHREALPEKANSPAMHVLTPPDGKQGQRGGGGVMVRGGQGKKIAHQMWPRCRRSAPDIMRIWP